jgi:hypothetical protein
MIGAIREIIATVKTVGRSVRRLFIEFYLLESFLGTRCASYAGRYRTRLCLASKPLLWGATQQDAALDGVRNRNRCAAKLNSRIYAGEIAG